ncbi:MAG TPA: LysR family transcriptional regulator [Acidobacteriaceae bacterium]|jgi:DNA-binding transcriptional LysR family regulator
MRIRDLELIVAVYETGNLTQAATQLGISEPALSKQLHVIERRIKIRLFDRGHNGATLTNQGQAFVEHALVSIQEYHRALHEAREAGTVTHHKLRIGTCVFLPTYLIELLGSIELRLYRDLTIEVFTAYSYDLLVKLQRHEIDLALVTSPPPIATITTLRIETNPFMIVLREGHPLATNSSVTLEDVATYPWIFFNRNVHPPLHDLILNRMHVLKREPRILHHISHADHIPALLTDDSLLAWLTPTGARRVANGALRFIPLIDADIRLETHLASIAGNTSPLLSEYVRSFMTRLEATKAAAQLSLPIGEEISLRK